MRPWTFNLFKPQLAKLQPHNVTVAIKAMERACTHGESLLGMQGVVFASSELTIPAQQDAIRACLSALAHANNRRVQFDIVRTGENMYRVTVRPLYATDTPPDDFELLIVVDLPNGNHMEEDKFDWFESEETNPGHVPEFNEQVV